VVLLNVSGDILFANEAAHSIADARDGLAFDRDQIMLSSQRDSDRLRKLIAAALDLGTHQPSTGGGAMVLQRPSGRLSLQLLVTPIVGQVSGAMPGASVALFIRDPERETGPGLQWLARAYGLTVAEARAASLIASGLSAPQVAAQLGLSPATVRTYLARAFDKTGVRFQVALARLLSALSYAHDLGGDA
jgi:DNA-binding CsgD family transcriptional regulator